MRIIIDRWLEFTDPIEGGVACLYNDVRGITTIAYGNMVNSVDSVMKLQFVHADGSPASIPEVVAAWNRVHSDPQCAHRGWTYAATLTDLRLTKEGMAQLAIWKLAQNDAILASRCPFWNDMPACAQMAMHSLAWACGPGAHFPRLFAALDVHDYGAAAIEIHMNEWTPEGIHNTGLIPRNVANKILMRNAAYVEACHLDPDTLEWKRELRISEAPTDPEVTSAASYPTIHPDPSTYLRSGKDKF